MTKKKRHRTPFIFTQEILNSIPVWVEMGARPSEIAAAIGSTVGTLQVVCSKAGISLSAAAAMKKHFKRDWPVLQREAVRRGISVPRLTTEIITAVVESDLFAAVLGDYDGEDLEAGARSCAER